MKGERRYSDWTIYRRVLTEARPYWGHIALLFLLNLLATPLALLAPLPLTIAVDSVLSGHPLPSFVQRVMPQAAGYSASSILIVVVVLMVGIELLNQLQSLAKSLLKNYTAEALTLRFRQLLFRHAQRLSITYHDRRGTTDAIYRIQQDASSIQIVAMDGVIPFAAAVIMFGSMLAVMMAIQPTIALIALAVTPVLGLLTWAYRRQLRTRHRHVRNLETRALAVVQEVLGSVRVVKAFGQEDREEGRFVAKATEGMRARLRVAFTDGSFGVAIGVVNAVGTAAVLYVGVRSVMAGTVSLGSLLLIMGYLAQLYGPLYTMSRQVASIQSGLVGAERAFAMLDEERDVPERADAKRLARAAGRVEFRDVGFQYDEARPVIEHVSFSVEPGMSVGIAGRTGAGKTTLVSLLTRFYDPTAGEIRLDGVDLRDYRISDLRDQFAIVLQDPVLFSTTIRENIAYGKPAATQPEIEIAAASAGVHEFIAQLPEGYDTVVGERGMMLSGGERQRIALARAFLKDAPILILDEPTSSVDVKTEAGIMDAMARLMEGRTSFMIAHRLSTLERCTLRVRVTGGTASVETSRDLAAHSAAEAAIGTASR